MKSMQRKFGKVMKRSADEGDVSVILKEFHAAEEMLDSLIKDLTSWRDSWDNILKNQLNTTEAFATMYNPITTADDAEANHIPAVTPEKYMEKCLGLQKVYSDTQLDLQQEISLMSGKLVKRAEDAKLHAKPLKKTIKHRENMKLDFERYLSRVEHCRKKEIRTPKDEATLAKHESDLAQARISYQTADDHVKENFPGVIEAIHSLMPLLLTNMIMLQTTMVGQLYTVMDEYTRQNRMPNPAPSDAEVIATFEHEFTGFRKELEGSLQLIAKGKTTHTSMALPEEHKSSTGLGIRNKMMGRKPPPPPPGSQHSISPRPSIASFNSSNHDEEAPAKPPRPGTAVTPGLNPPLTVAKQRSSSATRGQAGMLTQYEQRSNSLTPDWQQRSVWQDQQQSSGGATPPSRYGTPLNGSSPGQTSGNGDYFGSRRPSNASSIASAAAAAVAAKKKPPPPVPMKRLPSTTAQYVTALYDFEGQNAGDLPFREGDRIRVVKKTDSTDDWWDGELGGRTGSFPANYTQL